MHWPVGKNVKRHSSFKRHSESVKPTLEILRNELSDVQNLPASSYLIILKDNVGFYPKILK